MKNQYWLLGLAMFVQFCAFGQLGTGVSVKINTPATSICDPTGTTALSYTLNNPPKLTTNYTPEPIEPTFNPPFPTTGGTMLDATQDDVWSPVVTLPFTFSFYGNFYNQLVVGSNGLISFNTANANGYCPWAFTAAIPSPAVPMNAIFGIYQDTNIASPPVTNPAVQNVNYYVLDTGANLAPNRVFVVNFNQLPQFSCNNGVGLQTSQIVLHEASNLVEFFVHDRTCCPGWNSGSGVIGMQNATGTVGHLAGNNPANNTGCWSMTDSNFQIPASGPPVPHAVQWYTGGTPPPPMSFPTNTIPAGSTPIPDPATTPVGPGVYTVAVTFTYPNGQTAMVTNTMEVVLEPLDVSNPVDIAYCTPGVIIDIDQSAAMIAGSPSDPNPAHYEIYFYENQLDADLALDFNAIPDPSNYLPTGPYPQRIYVGILAVSGCYNVRYFDITDGPSGTFVYDGNPSGLPAPVLPGQYCTSLIGSYNINPTTLTTGGTFTVTQAPVGGTLTLDPATGAITPSTSTPGIYEVTYTIANPACPFSTTAMLEIVACNCSVTVSPSGTNPALCVGSTLTPIIYSTPGATSGTVTGTLPPGVSWAFNSATGAVEVTGVPNVASTYTYTVQLNVSAIDFCSATTTIVVSSTSTVTLNAGSNDNQSPCVGEAINNIVYTIDPTATGVSVSGLPTGVNFNITGNLLTISGTPSAVPASPTYTITFTGCNAAPVTGNINVQPSPTVTLVSGNNAQTPCFGAAITNVVYAYGGSATGLLVTGLPSGLTSAAGPGANEITISGTPTAIGNYTYQIETVSPCATNPIATGTVNVNALPTIAGASGLCVGANVTLTGSGTPATVNPWTSSNPAIASIDASGAVTGVTAGGPVTMTYTDSNGCTATHLITVNPLPTIGGTFTLCEGATSALTGSGTPATANAWTSDATGVATVSATGVVSGITGGTANITYTDINGCTATQAVTIIALPTITGATSLCLGTTTTLAGSGTPSATTPWTSSNAAIASIDALGVVTAHAAGGPVTITYTNSDGCTATSTITVNALPTIGGTFALCAASTTTLTGSGTPASTNAWVSDAPAVASVDATGTVTGIIGGTANITYTDINGCTTTQAVTVNPAPTISGTFTLCEGSTSTLIGSGTPAATNAWTSDAPAIATVNATGTVTGIAGGTANITYTDNTGCPITQLVTVVALPTITGASSLCEGATVTLTGSGTPSATTPWTSSNPAIASIDAAGVVTGLAAGGPVTMTYMNSDGCITTSTITVNPLPTIGGTFTLCEGATSALTGSGTPAAANAWTSDATGVATVSATGVVSGITGGTANITYTDINGCTATQAVTIIALPTITGATSLCLGTTTTLAGSGTPSATTPWTSSNAAIASIDALGVVTAHAAGGPVTITYTNSDGCTATSTITVNALPTIGGTFALCAASTTTLTGSGTPASTNAWVSDAPAVASVDATGTVTGIIGGTANITYTDINGCTTTQAITVNALPAITGTYNVCVGSVTTLGSSAAPAATAPWVSSDPAVATVNASGQVSGVAAGTAIITFTDSNGCQAQETVTVIALPTVAGTASLPDVCIATPMTAASYTFGGSATGLAIDPATTLPAGLSFAAGTANNFVLSGIPTLAGSYSFDIVTTGGTCPPEDRITVTMTVKPNATLTFGPSGSDNQTLCINTAITPILYTISNGATSAQISAGALPAGVTLTPNAGGMVFMISGTPTQAGIFNFTVSTFTVNGCLEASLPGRIEVTAPDTLALTSPLATTNQPACQGVAIMPITYMAGNAMTTITVTGLPAGITGQVNPVSGAFEITGASTVIGAHTYTVSNNSGCLPYASMTGTITITPSASITLTSAANTDNQRLCMDQEALDNIVFTVADGATGAFIFSGEVPVGISGSYNPTLQTFTISGIPTQSGTFDFVVRTQGGCGYSEAPVRIVVDPLPIISLPTDGFVCVDRNGLPVPGSSTVLTTGLPQANHTFEWSDANGVIPSAAGNSYTATAPGVYAVKVTNTLTGCYETQTTTVVTSLPPVSVVATASAYFSQEQVVTVVALPVGNYEYQVDNGAWQDSNNFFNLPSGEHQFLVRDKIGCGELGTSIIVIDYPRFFTPNNDGYNDTWNIQDVMLLGNQDDARIEIFDRYGKLLKQISPLGAGWDGTVNGKPVPATDYWFRLYYNDEAGMRKEFKAHFSIKR